MPFCAILALVLLAAGCGISERNLPRSPQETLRLVPHAFDALRSHVEADIPPNEMEAFLGAGSREEMLIPLDKASLYIESVPWGVVFVLLGKDGSIQETRSFVAFAFSVAWYQGLVVTLHHHPGTGMFYDQPMHVTVERGKLLIEDAEPGWPARHAD